MRMELKIVVVDGASINRIRMLWKEKSCIKWKRYKNQKDICNFINMHTHVLYIIKFKWTWFRFDICHLVKMTWSCCSERKQALLTICIGYTCTTTLRLIKPWKQTLRYTIYFYYGHWSILLSLETCAFKRLVYQRYFLVIKSFKRFTSRKTSSLFYLLSLFNQPCPLIAHMIFICPPLTMI